jgi:hypothetical protein
MPTAIGAGPCLDTVGRALPSRAAISFCERRIQAWSGDEAARATLSSIMATSVRGCVPALCQSSVFVGRTRAARARSTPRQVAPPLP